MRVGVYGGGFNPPHVGHALVAAWLRWTDLVDEVWLVPVAHHAFGKQMAPFEQRIRWCAALAETVGDWVKVCDVEGALPVPNYTLNTLDELHRRHGSHQFRLVIGADNHSLSHKWHRWAEIQRRFNPIVVGRQGYTRPEEGITFPEVSSTDIRARMAQGLSVDHLVPAGVLALMGE